MSKNLLLTKINENRLTLTKTEELVKISIERLAKEANDIRSQQQWKNVLFGCKYIPLFKKWLFLVRSPYYKETETTIFALAIENETIVLDCSFWLDEKRYTISESFYNDLIDVFLAIIDTSDFSNMILVFNDLANKNTYDLTIFWGDYLQYTPENLYIKVGSSYFKTLIDDSTGKCKEKSFSIKCDKINIVQQPFALNDYKGKLGEINGYRVICADVNENNLTLDFIYQS